MSDSSINVVLSISVVQKKHIEFVAAESQPYLCVFLSGQIDKCATVKQVQLVDTIESKFKPSTVELSCNNCRKECDGRFACIGIQLMCHLSIAEESSSGSEPRMLGYSGYEPIGGGAIYISEILKAPQRTFTIEIRDRSLDDEIKGSLPRMVLAIDILHIDIKNLRINGEWTPKQHTKHAKRMHKLTESFIDTYRYSLKPTVSDANSMHVPKYLTSISGLKLPASAFVLATPNTRCTSDMAIDFMMNCISAVCSMNGWLENSFYNVIEDQLTGNHKVCTDKFIIACRLMCEAYCLFPNCCDYVFDKAGSSDVERFIDIVWSLCGDCDDLARFPVIVQQFIYLSKYKFTSGMSSKIDAYTKRASLIASWSRLYVFVIGTGIATLPAVGKGENAEDVPICHIYSIGVPRVSFFKWLLADISSSAQKHSENDEPLRKFESSQTVPGLIFEGTNFSEGLQMPLGTYMREKKNILEATKGMEESNSKRNKLERKYNAIRQFSIMSKQDNVNVTDVYRSLTESSFSPFYRRTVDAWTWNLDYWGINITDLSFGYGTQTEGTKRSGYAVDFRDLVTSSDKITLIPTFTYSDKDMDIVKNTLMQEPPFYMDWAIMHTEDYEAFRSALHESLMKQSANLVKLSQFAVYGSSLVGDETTPIVPRFISYRLNHVNKLTFDMVKALDNALNNHDVTHIAWNVHPITRDFDLYIIDIKVYV